MHEDHCPGLHACPLCAKIAPRLGHAAPLAGSSVSQDGSEYSLPGRYSSAPRSSGLSIVEKISALLPGDKSDLPHPPQQAGEKTGEQSCGQHYAAPRQDVFQPTGIPEKISPTTSLLERTAWGQRDERSTSIRLREALEACRLHRRRFVGTEELALVAGSQNGPRRSFSRVQQSQSGASRATCEERR
jgi:hypothetical protein